MCCKRKQDVCILPPFPFPADASHMLLPPFLPSPQHKQSQLVSTLLGIELSHVYFERMPSDLASYSLTDPLVALRRLFSRIMALQLLHVPVPTLYFQVTFAHLALAFHVLHSERVERLVAIKSIPILLALSVSILCVSYVWELLRKRAFARKVLGSLGVGK